MRPLVVAHRGSSGVAPENTVAAFMQAVDDGADMIELDVRMTRDFEIVVLHDRTVRRTTNGRGNIWDLTLSHLRSLDAGSWFNKKFSGERIPTLRHVISLLPPYLRLNIEVKTDGRRLPTGRVIDDSSSERRKRIAFEESLILVLREREFVQRVLVSSFDHKFLHRFHKLAPDIPIGTLYSPVRDMARRPSTIARQVGATTFVCSVARLCKRFADDIHGHGLTLACYGVNTRRQFDKAVRFGTEMIITNYPKQMRKYLK